MNEIRPIRDVSDRPATLMSFTARFFCPTKRDAEKRCPPPRRDGLTAVWIAVANDGSYFFLFFSFFVLIFSFSVSARNYVMKYGGKSLIESAASLGFSLIRFSERGE